MFGQWRLSTVAHSLRWRKGGADVFGNRRGAIARAGAGHAGDFGEQVTFVEGFFIERGGQVNNALAITAVALGAFTANSDLPSSASPEELELLLELELLVLVTQERI